MSRPRTPTNILEARGAFKRNPDRKRVDPKSDSAFPRNAPAHLTPIQVKWWHKIKKAIPAGVLQGSDVFAVELAAILWAEFITCPQDMPTSRIGLLKSTLGTLGMSPVDRAKLAGPAAEEDDDF